MTSASAKGAKTLLLLLLAAGRLAAISFQKTTIEKILLDSVTQLSAVQRDAYLRLLPLAPGQAFNSLLVRKSIDTLYRTGDFTAIEAKVERLTPQTLNLHFWLQKKFVIRSLVFNLPFNIRKKEVSGALFALRLNDHYEETNLEKAVQELRNYFHSQGYFSPIIEPRVDFNPEQAHCAVHFRIGTGPLMLVRTLTVEVDNPQMEPAIRRLFQNEHSDIPVQLEKRRQAALRLLNKNHFLLPEIQINENVISANPARADLLIRVRCGYRYHFRFQGLTAKQNLIQGIWEKNIFEKYAEEESRSRLLNYLQNDGYLNADLQTQVKTEGMEKTITFTARQGRRYPLGRIRFQGNSAVTADKLLGIIQINDQIFDRIFWLRGTTLQSDLQILRLYYYSLGYPNAQIKLNLSFALGKVDVLFQVSEGKRQWVENLVISGNQRFSTPLLMSLIKTRAGGPFVQRQLSEDIDALQNFYWRNGFAEAQVGSELSATDNKTVRIKIDEGPQKHMGDLIILGGSATQRALIKKLFPLTRGEPYSKEQIETFRAEVENSAIFNEVHVEALNRTADRIDLLVKVSSDQSRFYGLGLGWVERQGLRGTFEFHQKNLFQSYSSFSTLLQVGRNERRGIVSYDTPFFLKSKLASSFNLWEEDEIFPSYRYRRWGIGASLIRQYARDLNVVLSLKWYRTTLTELGIPEAGVDRLHTPFDTTSLSLALVRDRRDDPFNPRRGSFFSADLRLGLPLLQKDYKFIKFFWNYQQHLKFLKNGVLSCSLRNGIGFGDMSITERFFAGGSHSFRGTRNDRLGPLSLVTDQPQGGNALMLLNLETTFPILLLPIENLYYSFFLDIGNVFANSEDFRLLKMERALGFGLKYKTPIGPIRLDLAWNPRRRVEQAFLIQIGIGNVY